MTGPWQEPVSDVALTATSYRSYTGEAMAMGERTNLAIIDAPASCRMAIAEAITNIAGANIGDIKNIKLSANWMCACGEDGEDAALYASVKTVGEDICPKLGVSIPVGKDSLSMRTVWQDSKSQTQKIIAPLSLVASSFSPVKDVRKTVTADIKNIDAVQAESPDKGLARVRGSKLILLDLGQKKNRLGGSALAQVYNQVGNEHPDLEDTALFIKFFNVVQELVEKGLILSYHDRSDGGLIVTVLEMAFAGRKPLKLVIDELGTDPLSILFSEELVL
jgi:phosphoribosylformylglycinamidine synthase